MTGHTPSTRWISAQSSTFSQIVRAAPGLALPETHAAAEPEVSADPFAIELANEALNAARGAGATYADVRVGRYRRQEIQTREKQVAGVSDTESYGIGIRTLQRKIREFGLDIPPRRRRPRASRALAGKGS